jgi:hypothetical protein
MNLVFQFRRGHADIAEPLTYELLPHDLAPKVSILRSHSDRKFGSYHCTHDYLAVSK